MWYFAWILGLGFAAAFAALNLSSPPPGWNCARLVVAAVHGPCSGRDVGVTAVGAGQTTFGDNCYLGTTETPFELLQPGSLDEPSTSALGTEEASEEVGDRGGAVSDDQLAQSPFEWRGSREQANDGTGGEQCQPDHDG